MKYIILVISILFISCEKNILKKQDSDFIEFYGKKFSFDKVSIDFKESVNAYQNNPKEAIRVSIRDGGANYDLPKYNFQLSFVLKTNKPGNGPVEGDYVKFDDYVHSFDETMAQFDAHTGIITEAAIQVIDKTALNKSSRKFPDDYRNFSNLDGKVKVTINEQNKKNLEFDFKTYGDGESFKGKIIIQ